MQEGGVAIRRSTAGLIGDALLSTSSGSPRYLYFYPGMDEEKAQPIDLATVAHYCRTCGILVIKEERGDAGDDLTCMSCGREIPAHAQQCPACGWTWDAAGSAT
jgi:hypothetical protein